MYFELAICHFKELVCILHSSYNLSKKYYSPDWRAIEYHHSRFELFRKTRRKNSSDNSTFCKVIAKLTEYLQAVRRSLR